MPWLIPVPPSRTIRNSGYAFDSNGTGREWSANSAEQTNSKRPTPPPTNGTPRTSFQKKFFGLCGRRNLQRKCQVRIIVPTNSFLPQLVQMKKFKCFVQSPVNRLKLGITMLVVWFCGTGGRMENGRH